MLARQVAEVSADGCTAGILVVDNDPAGSGGPVIDAFRSEVVRYVVESEPGIAAGRNRALDEAGDADLLVFIDDDERPQDAWLRSLLATHTATGAAAVAGPVVSTFEGALDPWMHAGDFFSRRQLPTGSSLDVAATNNLLLDLRVVRRAGLRFDARFGLSGGEDSLFTRSLAAAGAPMVWCAEAVVSDVVTADRMTRRWVLSRAFSSGNSVTRVDLALAGTVGARWSARATACRRGLPRLAGGGARWVVGTLIGSARHRARGVRTLARGAGMLAGAFGHSYQEYRRLPS